MNADRALRVGAVVLVLGLGAVGIAMPHAIVLGGCAWLAMLCFALSGWGWIVARALRIADVDFGLRAVWGVAGYLAIAGLLVMLGVCSRPVVLALIGVGLAGFAWREWVTPDPLWQVALGAGHTLRERPIAGYVAIAIGAAVALHVVGAVAYLDRNPWDDDIAYTPLLKRLLAAGDLVEPFSFRRLASYGGQTVLQALVGARGNLASIHALDRGLGFALVAMLLVGHARERRVPGFWLALAALVVLLAPEPAINTAATWSGVACFYALYRTIARADSRGGFAAAALVGAATCTLRMNFLAVVVPFLAITLALRARRGWRAELRAWRLAILIGIAALLPWCIAAFISSRTFLYPVMDGTWNHALHLQPTAWSWVDELGFFVQASVGSEPIVVMPVIFVLFVFARDERPGRPLTALFVASSLGFVLLAHSLTDADIWSIWRYAFGYMLTLVLALAIDGGYEGPDDGPVRVPPLARWTLLAALLVQLLYYRGTLIKRFDDIFKEVGEARHAASEQVVEGPRYRAMQAAVPAGARLAVMVDDPVFLDFGRNDIVNLDTPGFASPAPQWPSFAGPEAVRAYLLDEGLRYVAFVRGDHSRYYYRHEFWTMRAFNDNEFFELMSAYLVDAIESFATLATTSKVLYDQDGLVVLDLDAPHEPALALDPAGEPARRGAFVRSLAERTGVLAEWSLNSRPDILFDEGMTGIVYLDTTADPRWYEVVTADPNPTRGTPVRWLHRRVHFRVRGDRDMHLVVRGHINLGSVFTRPRLDISLDGELLGSANVDDDGKFVADLVVPAAKLDGWCDLYAIFNAIGDSARDVHDLKIARLEEVIWEPR
jgi:hypothetical protein